LAGFLIEGQARARYVDLNGEGSENDRGLVSTQERARCSGMSTSTIRRWIETGRLEAFRLEDDSVSPSLWTRAAATPNPVATKSGCGDMSPPRVFLVVLQRLVNASSVERFH